MAQSVPAAIPLQVPTPPRALEGLSGKMDRLAPTVLNQFEELSGQIGKLAPTTFDEYVRDFWQRSVLFWISCANAATNARECWRVASPRF